MSPVLSPMPKYVLNIPLSFANETGVFKVVEWILTCVVFLLLSNLAQLWLPYWNSLPVYFGRRSQNGVCTPHSQRSADTNGNEYVDWLILIYWETYRRSWGMVDWLVVWLTNRPSDGPLTDSLWQSDWLTVWQNDWLTDRATDWLTNQLADCLTEQLTDLPTNWLTDWATDWLTNWLTEPPTDLPNDWLTKPLTDLPNDWLTEPLSDLPTDWRSNLASYWVTNYWWLTSDWLTTKRYKVWYNGSHFSLWLHGLSVLSSA